MSPTSCQTAPPRARYRSGIIAFGSKNCQTFLRRSNRKSCSLAATAVIGAPGIAEGAEGLEENTEVRLLPSSEAQRLPLGSTCLRVVAYRVRDPLDLAVVPVRRREQHVAQRRDLECVGRGGLL